MKPEVLREKLIECLSGKFRERHAEYTQDDHGSILLKCPLKAFYDMREPILDIQTCIRFQTGLNWDEKVKELLTELFGPTEEESVEFHGTIFSPDYMHNEFIVEVKFTDTLYYGRPRNHDVDQLAQYCAVTHKLVGFLLYITLNVYDPESGKFQPDLVIFRYDYTPTQLEELRQLIADKISQYTLIFDILEHGGELDPTWVSANYAWECKYCDYSIRCKEIKQTQEAQNMPYKKVTYNGEPETEFREFPETFKFTKAGDKLEGVVLAIRAVEYQNKRSGKQEHTTVYEIETKKGTFSVWGGRKDFDNKMGQVQEGQKVKIERLAQEGTRFIPFDVAVWED